MNKPSLDVVHRLVGLYPKAVEEHDKVGRLPLHLACSHNASFEVVEYLIERYPEGVIELTDRGVRISSFACKKRLI
jgi:ankyrin repeat protein